MVLGPYKRLWEENLVIEDICNFCVNYMVAKWIVSNKAYFYLRLSFILSLKRCDFTL